MEQAKDKEFSAKEAAFYAKVAELFRRRGKEDLFFLAKYILGRTRLKLGRSSFDEHHEDLCRDLMAIWRNRFNSDIKEALAVRWPRGTLKSTICTIAFPIWVLINDPNTRVLIDSENATISGRFLKAIKGHLESRFFQEIFGVIYNPRKDWNDDILVIKRDTAATEPSVDKGGVDKEKTSQHFDLIIADDIVGRTNSRNIEQVEKVNEHAGLYQTLMDPGAMLLLPMTRWAFGDLGEKIDEENAQAEKECRRKPYRISHFACYKKDAEGNFSRELEFPKLHTHAQLDHARRIMQEYMFSCNYLVHPSSPTTAIFQEKWLRYHELPYGNLPEAGANVYITVDPARAQKKTSDFSAIVVAAVTCRFDIYILDVVRQHMTDSEIWDHLVRLSNIFKPISIGIETVFKQKRLFAYMKSRQANEGEVLGNFHQFKTQTVQKSERIRGLGPFVENGKFFLGKSAEFSYLKDEMLKFDPAKIDVQRNDCLDASAYLVEMINKPAGEIPPAFFDNPLWREEMEKENDLRRERGQQAKKIPSQTAVRVMRWNQMKNSRMNRDKYRPMLSAAA